MATIQGIYIALFGRPADPFGLAFFNEATNNGADLTAIGDLAATAEYQSRFEGQTNVQIVNSIYQSLFNRDADLAGLTFFVNALASGELNINNIAIAIYDGAQNEDLEILQNKEAAANLFTASLDTGAEVSAYVGDAAAAAGRAFLDGVTDDDSTIPTQAETDAAIQAIVDGTTQEGDIFTLTAPTNPLTGGVDEIMGTAGNDTFRAVTDDSLGSADILHGMGGFDVLEIADDAFDGGADIAPVITGIERINNGELGPTLSLADVTGLQQLWSVEGGGGGTFRYADASTSVIFGSQDLGPTQTATIEIDFAGSGATEASFALQNAGDSVATFDIVADSDADDIESVSILAAEGNGGAFALANTGGGGFGSLETVTVSGPGAIVEDGIGIDGFQGIAVASLVTFDASANTGGVEVDLDGASDDLETVLLGSGNDFLGLAGIESGVTITGGAGNDTYIFDDVANIDTATEDDFEAEIVSITDFNATEDFLDLPTLTQVTVTTTQQGQIDSQTSLFDAVTYVAENVADANDELAVFTYEGSTYAFVQGGLDPTAFDADDGLIELTGFTGALNATNFDAA